MSNALSRKAGFDLVKTDDLLSVPSGYEVISHKNAEAVEAQRGFPASPFLVRAWLAAQDLLTEQQLEIRRLRGKLKRCESSQQSKRLEEYVERKD